MPRPLARLTALCLCALALLAPDRGSAEWRAGIYLGAGRTVANDNEFMLGGTAVRSLEGDDTSGLFGARLEYWSRQRPWAGLAVDISVLNPAFRDAGPPQPAGEVTLTKLPISVLFMLRHRRTKTGADAGGRVTPYFAIGPSLVFSALSEFAGSAVPPPAVLEDTSWTLGLDVRAGVTAPVSGRADFFAEYRYVGTRASFESATGGGTVVYEPALGTWAGLLGIAFRF